MNVLLNYITLEELEELKDTFDTSVFHQLQEDNVTKIIEYLKDNHIFLLEDIIKEYLDLFLLDYKEFISKFEKLKNLYHNNFAERLAYNLNILEGMYL